MCPKKIHKIATDNSPIQGLSGKHILVTGAGGFIGSHLVEFLCSQGARVTALFRYTSGASLGALEGSPALGKIKKQFGDIRDPETCLRAVKAQDIIVHLAAQIAIPYSYLSPRDFVDVNVSGTTNLLQSALGVKSLKRFVVVSSSEVYGSAQYTPIDEAHPLCPQSPYAASKVAADKMAESYHKSFGLPLTIVRPFNTYGPRQSPRAIVPTIICQALGSSKLKLGSTAPKRDFLYVKDTVRGMALAAVSSKTLGETINLCSGAEISVRELAARIGALVGKKLTITRAVRRVRPKNSEIIRLLGDGKKAARLCGFQAEYSLDDGLPETIDYYRIRNVTLSAEDYCI